MYFFSSADNADLKAGITSVSKLLDLPDHYDHFVLLQVGLLFGKGDCVALTGDLGKGVQRIVVIDNQAVLDSVLQCRFSSVVLGLHDYNPSMYIG